jgi:hypothetical protein
VARKSGKFERAMERKMAEAQERVRKGEDPSVVYGDMTYKGKPLNATNVEFSVENSVLGTSKRPSHVGIDPGRKSYSGSFLSDIDWENFDWDSISDDTLTDEQKRVLLAAAEETLTGMIFGGSPGADLSDLMISTKTQQPVGALGERRINTRQMELIISAGYAQPDDFENVTTFDDLERMWLRVKESKPYSMSPTGRRVYDDPFHQRIPPTFRDEWHRMMRQREHSQERTEEGDQERRHHVPPEQRWEEAVSRFGMEAVARAMFELLLEQEDLENFMDILEPNLEYEAQLDRSRIRGYDSRMNFRDEY